MKYPLMISFFVISLVTATQIVDQLNISYFNEKGRPLFGYVNGMGSAAYSQKTAALSRFNEDNINGTVNEYINPNQQPSGGTSLLTWIDQWIKSLKAVNIIFNTLFYCTIGFGVFVNQIFYVPLGNTNLLSDTWVGALGLAIGILQFLQISAFIRGMNIGD
jgi:hypothetical protein